MRTAIEDVQSLLQIAEDEALPLPDRLAALDELSGRAVTPQARPHELSPSEAVRRDLAAVRLRIPACPGMGTARVHHRDWPELHGEGPTPRDAAGDLLRHLIAQSSSLDDGWHRGELDRIVADVRAFLARAPEPSRAGDRSADARGAGTPIVEAGPSAAGGRVLGTVRGSIDPGGRAGDSEPGPRDRAAPRTADESDRDVRGGRSRRVRVEGVGEGWIPRSRAWGPPPP